MVQLGFGSFVELEHWSLIFHSVKKPTTSHQTLTEKFQDTVCKLRT